MSRIIRDERGDEIGWTHDLPVCSVDGCIDLAWGEYDRCWADLDGHERDQWEADNADDHGAERYQ